MQLVLGWPVRLLVIGLLIFSLVVDGAAYIYRLQNHIGLNQPLPPGATPQVLGANLYLHRGLDLSGGSDMMLQLSNFPAGRSRSDVQNQTIQVIQKRINSLGVNEPQINPVGNDRIEVQLAGVPASKAQQVIGQTARLVVTGWVPDSSVQGGPHPGYKPQITPLKAEMLSSANAGLDQNGSGWVVNVTYDSQGAGILNNLSQQQYNACQQQGCPQQFMAQWLDLTQSDVDNWAQVADQVSRPYDQGGKLVVDAVTQQVIPNGQMQISGTFNQSTATNLAVLLNDGALPVNINVISSTDVGASLGAQSVTQSLAAGLLGLIIVVVFMIAFYRLPGVLASIALLFYAGLVLAIFKALGQTVTLPGLAGFILSVGMAVDANVLIFERFKEEMRAGRTIGAGVEAAVRRAWPAIRDSNTATLITSIILFFAASGSVKGFALTLIIGVLCSLISSIIVTHNLLAIVLNFGWTRSGPLMLGVARGRA
ncbi:MAG: protein translocase subunit SecD [Candidatus Dormibacteraeota bacterium]|nr:protein translocase subunit SecD [Candidatus Dormibacteraeota bacterium]